MNQQDRHTEISVQTEDAESVSGNHVSLENVHGSITVPHHLAGFWKQWRAFVGPAILVSVGYMDPGNWGTDIQGGAQFKYGLLWVVGLASLMAIFMHVISSRLGVVTGKDLAQCCRDWYPQWTRWPNWMMSEVGIGACDLATICEVMRLYTSWRLGLLASFLMSFAPLKTVFFFAKPVTPLGVCSGAERSRASAASSSRPLTASTDEISAGCKARVEREKVSEGAYEDDE